MGSQRPLGAPRILLETLDLLGISGRKRCVHIHLSISFRCAAFSTSSERKHSLHASMHIPIAIWPFFFPVPVFSLTPPPPPMTKKAFFKKQIVHFVIGDMHGGME